MKHNLKVECIPHFIKGKAGNLYTVYFPPQKTKHTPRNIIYIPPFSEEANRCRAMTSLQARTLASQGVGVLIIDPFGTGDSAGNFVDGNWQLWQEDILTGINWLKQEYNYDCDTLWGTRLGAMLAIDVAYQLQSIKNLIFWQPVVNGKNFLTQFLRIRIAAELNEKNGIKSTSELRQQFKNGESVEVSGYEVSSELAISIDDLKISKLLSLNKININWFDVHSTEKIITSRATQKVLNECKQTKTTLTLHQIKGPAFWQLHERFLAPDLIKATTAVITGI